MIKSTIAPLADWRRHGLDIVVILINDSHDQDTLLPDIHSAFVNDYGMSL
jgi:hypothetical protein